MSKIKKLYHAIVEWLFFKVEIFTPLLPIGAIGILTAYLASMHDLPAYLILLVGVASSTFLMIMIDAGIEIYKKLTLDKKLIFSSMEVARHSYYENQCVIQLRCFLANISSFPIFYTIKDMKYFLSNTANLKSKIINDGFVASNQAQPLLLPIIDNVVTDHAQNKEMVIISINYGKDRDNLIYKFDLEIEINLFFLPEDPSKLIMNYAVKNIKYT